MSTSVHDYRSATRGLIITLGRMIRANQNHSEAGLWQQVFDMLVIALRREQWDRAQELAFRIDISMSRMCYRGYHQPVMDRCYECATWLHWDLDLYEPVEQVVDTDT